MDKTSERPDWDPDRLCSFVVVDGMVRVSAVSAVEFSLGAEDLKHGQQSSL